MEEFNKSFGFDCVLYKKDIEGSLAQSTAEDVKNVARQQAEQIVKDAKGNAQKEADGLVQEINMKKKELDDLKKQFDVYKAKMEALLISQLELLKDINKEEE